MLSEFFNLTWPIWLALAVGLLVVPRIIANMQKPRPPKREEPAKEDGPPQEWPERIRIDIHV